MQFIRLSAKQFAPVMSAAICGLFALGSSNASVRAADVAMQDISITSLGHEHILTGSSYVTRDGIGAFGGSYSAPNFSATLQHGDTLIQHITAPAGKEFSVTLDPAYSYQAIDFNFFWQDGSDGVSLFGGTISFDNLVGNVPVASTSLFGVGNTGNAVLMDYTAQFTSSVTFTGITISIPVQPSPPADVRNFHLGTNSSVPFEFVGLASTDVDVPMGSLVDVPEPATMGLMILPGVVLLKRRR